MQPDGAIVILLGAGAGRRLGGAAAPKALLPIGGRPILAVAAAAAAASSRIAGLVVTFPLGWEAEARADVEAVVVPTRFTEGGDSRQLALAHSRDDADMPREREGACSGHLQQQARPRQHPVLEKHQKQRTDRHHA